VTLKDCFYPAVIAALVAPGLAIAQAGPGQQASAPDEAGASAATAVDQVVVTANRTPAPIQRVGQSFTIITTAQIQADQETDIADIVARTPGVSLARNGGPGEAASLFLRGADSDQTLVLVDGVKINDPSDPGSGYDFSNLMTGDVARVEILRGPQSTLYGSEAIGGVVNVITADATRPLEGEARLEGGSYGTAYASASVGGKEDRFAWRVGAYYNSTDGVSAFDKTFGGVGSDPFHTAGATGRFHYDITPRLQFDERAYFTWSRNEFDGYDTPSGYFGNDNEFGRTTQIVDYTGLNLSLLGGRFQNRLAYEYSGIDRRNEDPDQGGTKFTFLDVGETNIAEYEGTFAIAPSASAVFGAQSERSTIDANSPLFPPAVTAGSTINSGYGQMTSEVLPGLTLTAGGRYDDHSRFGGHGTAQASAAWSLNDGNTVLRASFGQGFKAPSLYQLYSPYGNLSLRPEEANGWDAGVEQRFLDGRIDVQATYFGRVTRNLIEFISCYGVTTGGCATNTAGGYYDNVSRAEAEGVELQAAWKVTHRFSLTGNYTYDAVVDRSPGAFDYGQQLARRPRNTANVTASYLWPNRLRTDLAIRYADRGFDQNGNVIPLQSYTLWDVRASYPLNARLEIYGRIENLTDKHYETAYQYGTLGRAAYGGVKLSF
jgi:vitamin B12 transporter